MSILLWTVKKGSPISPTPEIRGKKNLTRVTKANSDACVSICTVWIQPAKRAFDPKNNSINDLF